MSSWMRSLSSNVLSTSTRKTMELGSVISMNLFDYEGREGFGHL